MWRWCLCLHLFYVTVSVERKCLLELLWEKNFLWCVYEVDISSSSFLQHLLVAQHSPEIFS